MSDFQPLGKAIKPIPTGEVIEDEYERFIGIHGDKLMRNKRTGAIASAVPKKIVEPPPETATCLQRQEEDGFPLNEFGVL